LKSLYNRNDAIVSAHAAGEYSYQKIAEFYNLHLTTIGKIARKAK
jgi:transposase